MRNFLLVTALALIACPILAASTWAEGYVLKIGTHTTVSNNKSTVKLWSEEAGQGEVLLILHGFGSHMYTWRKVAPALAKFNRVILVDLKGSGRSEKPTDGRYDLDEHVSLLMDFIQRRKLTNLTIVGHSFGGGIALSIAQQFAARAEKTPVKKLVLIGSMGYEQPLPQFVSLLRVPVISALGVRIASPEYQARSALEESMLNHDLITEEVVTAYARPLHDAGALHALVKSAQQIFPKNFQAMIAGYRTLRTPALLIWCKQDGVVPLWVGQRLANDLPQAQLVTIDKCGHLVQEEAPADIIREVEKFSR